MIKIKVLVVDDSVFMRKLISRLIEEDPTLEVVGTARNGKEGVQLVKELRPDVVTMDIEMPEMTGLQALTIIMDQRPTPVLMLSSLTQDGASATITALQNGAVDFISKPSGPLSLDLIKVKEELITKIKLAAQVPIRQVFASKRMAERVALEPKIDALNGLSKQFDQIVALGTSTGGPRALETVITALPANFPYPLLVVQHMPPKFTKSLADRLNRITNVHVVEAEDNQLLVGGTVYIAPGDSHITVVQSAREYRVRLNKGPLVNGHRPSVDVLFHSVAKLKIPKRHFILMTGMGSDGADGMYEAKKLGAYSTIAESKETCIVYGMPKSAVELGCVDYIIPVHQITSKLLRVTGVQKH
ncbi:MAG TPA: chemotaxis response regulator protein-glutamate methylesterase [Candidatus Paenibacillus intestinavium]|nr:chemotaxis response regulator protein-glutamate methylesterase [Candidatus Paenibacillus intestinavium]